MTCDITFEHLLPNHPYGNVPAIVLRARPRLLAQFAAEIDMLTWGTIDQIDLQCSNFSNHELIEQVVCINNFSAVNLRPQISRDETCARRMVWDGDHPDWDERAEKIRAVAQGPARGYLELSDPNDPIAIVAARQ